MLYKFEQKLKEKIVSSGQFVIFEQINEKTDLVIDLGFDSINFVELIVALEEEFDIEFDDDDLILEKLSTYGSLVEILKNKLT